MTIKYSFDREKDLETIISHYGIQSQLCKVQEEAEELNLVLDDPMDTRIRNLSGYRKELLDELVDVSIMAYQSLMIVRDLIKKHNFTKHEFNPHVNFKIDRTLWRIEDEIREQAQEG
jgi:hypothetical protein